MKSYVLKSVFLLLVALIACTAAPPGIIFVMEDEYALGEAIEFRVKNDSDRDYSYWINHYCPSAKLYRPDGSSFLAGHEGRVFGNVECDASRATTLEPGEEVVLMTWDQCVGDELVQSGTYTVSDLPFTNGLNTEAETTLVISGSDSEDPSFLCPSHFRK